MTTIKIYFLKAFDSVNHKVLLNILLHAGFGEPC